MFCPVQSALRPWWSEPIVLGLNRLQSMKSSVETRRLQLDLSAQRIKEVDQMSELTGVKTRREFVDQAIVFFAWAISERQKGRLIGSIDEDSGGYREVVLPAFASIRYETKNQASSSPLPAALASPT